jgi:hypothetical protein
MLRIPHCLDSRLTVGGVRRTRFNSQKYFLVLNPTAIVRLRYEKWKIYISRTSDLQLVAQCLNHLRNRVSRGLRKATSNTYIYAIFIWIKRRHDANNLLYPKPHATFHFSTNEWSESLEAFTAVTMKNDAFWDVMPCGSSIALAVVLLRSVRRFLDTANVVPSSQIIKFLRNVGSYKSHTV